MSVKLKEELLSLAAAEALAKIRHDRNRVSPNLRPALEHIEAHLFDPGLDVNSLKRACGVTNRTLTQFHAEVGETPHFYIKLRRADTAKRLLRDTKLQVGEIAELMGYADTRTFSRAFNKAYPMKPSEYRAQARREADSPPMGRDLKSIEVWRLAFDRKLEVHEAAALIEHLRKLYELDAGVAPLPWPTDGEEYERFTAERAWRAIEDQPREEQLAAVRFQAKFSTPAFFELLREKSREAGRQDRQRGLQLAELALASLEGSAEKLGDRLPDLKARGWAWLGNVRRQALDFTGAEEALALAESVLAPPGQRDPVAEGEIYLYQACLRQNQRRFKEALELSDLAIRQFRSTGDAALLAQSLVVRANVNCYSGEPSASVDDLTQAIEILKGHNEPFVLFSASLNLAMVYAMLNRYELTAEILPIVKPLALGLENDLVRHQLQWVEALVAEGQGQLQKAEYLLMSARSGFIAEEETDNAAVASLELAILCCKQNRHSDALRLAAEALPVFQALKAHPDAAIAVDVLAKAIASRTITAAEIQQVRNGLLRLKFAPGTDSATEDG
ncbi:MAG: helix-turn-helix transcriptional regulator [bacterium]|nr:helix-turn-helix transcriptional regulator [bacterium]